MANVFTAEAPWGRCTRWLTCITVDPAQFGATREDIRLALEREDIASRPLWKPMHLQSVFVGGEVTLPRPLPVKERRGVAEALFRYGLCLPSGTAMTGADIERVAGVVRSCRR